MNDTLTDDELRAIEARANAATPGPWYTEVSSEYAIVHNANAERWAAHTEERNKLPLGCYDPRVLPLEECRYCNKGPLVKTEESLSSPDVVLTYHTHLIPAERVTVIYDSNGSCLLQDDDYDVSLNVKNDTVFAAHARVDIPRLIAEVRRLRDFESRLRIVEEEIERRDLEYTECSVCHHQTTL